MKLYFVVPCNERITVQIRCDSVLHQNRKRLKKKDYLGASGNTTTANNFKNFELHSSRGGTDRKLTSTLVIWTF